MCDVAHMQASIDSSQDLIWSVDLNFALVTYNKAFALHFKNNRGVIIAPGMLSHETLPPEAAALWPPMYQLVLDKGPCRAHYPLNDGRFLDLSFVPIRQNGSVVGISILGRDITEQKAALERLSSTLEVLRASESRYRIAFQTSMDAMSITRFSDGVYLDVNEAALNGFGFTREEFIGAPRMSSTSLLTARIGSARGTCSPFRANAAISNSKCGERRRDLLGALFLLHHRH